MTTYFKEFLQEEIENTEVLEIARDISKQIYEFISSKEIKDKIAKVHMVGAKSSQVQDIISSKCKEIGFSSEKKGLFSQLDIPIQLRPDFYIKIKGAGLIIEVERGKTIDNNMDLLDLWKCHICEQSDYLLLIVPIIKQTKKGTSNNIYKSVIKRVASFFEKNNYVNIKGCFVIGY
jgi:predicted XRE-type DNA-binding protein